jgi:diguanylate cyclase (GGDEF)-like protein
MFAFGLMLLGSPAAAVAAALAGATLHAIKDAANAAAIVTHVGGAAVSLSTAGLVLMVMDVHGSITHFDTVPWRWGLAIVLTGFSIIVTNALLAAIELSLRRRISFVGLLRRGIGVRVTAEGALLSLAPLWVIGVDFSVVLVPLLGITTLLVFGSTRQALERSHEANHDSLTGLLNRRSFLENVHDALIDPRSTMQATLLVMDLNGFKDINDELGHQIGDALLVAFGERLERRIPVDSIACRLGGDEFAVLMMERAENGGVDHLVAQLHRDLVAALDIDGFPVSVGVSIGVATAPADGQTTSDLLRAADVAMYRAKRTGEASARYENCVRAPQRGRLNLLGDLGKALRHHQLHINFQPQLRIADGTVDTVEALIRWTHPEHGVVPPSEFIGLAEQTDLIGPLTDRVLRLATQMLASHPGGTFRLAINVSARSLQDRHFAKNVLAILAESGFSPNRLELEITERALVSNAERSIYTIDQLRRQGVRIAIDDFGVGYSSYQTLRLLKVDRVKIDRDFIQELLTQPRDRLIVASLIKLSHDLGLDVVAEGVESERVWNELAALECDVGQGYGIAVPMGYPELRAWLTEWDRVLDTRQLVSGQIGAR